MRIIIKQIRWGCAGLAAALVLICACSKDFAGDAAPLFVNDGGKEYYADSGHNSYNSVENLAIATVWSREGVRFVRLDGVSSSQVINPNEIAGIPDGTRVFLQYRHVLASSVASFCSGAILVEWASPLDVGEIRYEMSAFAGDPVDILTDWITSLEDGFLTLHYSIQASGSVKHEFSLYPSVEPDTYRLVHDARGDSKGNQTEGIVCFDVSGVLPDTDGETVDLHLDYIDLTHTKKRLTIEYRSPK